MLLVFNVHKNLYGYCSLAENVYAHFLHPDITTARPHRKRLATHKAYRKLFHPLSDVSMAMEIIITFYDRPR